MPKPPSRSSAATDERRRWLPPVLYGGAVLVVLALAYTLFWFQAAANLRQAADVWRAERVAEGWTVAWSALAVDGYPWRLRLTVEAPLVGQAETDRPWSWKAERGTAQVAVWSPRSVTVRLDGKHDVRLTTAGRGIALTGTAKKAEATATLSGGRIDGLEATLRGLSLEGDDQATIAAADLEARLLPGGPEPTSPGARLRLVVRDATAPALLALPFGPGVAAAVLEADLLGPLTAGPLEAVLPAWRDAGGTIEVKRLRVRHGPAEADADGTIALDGDLQPIGAFTVHSRGFFAVVELLRRRGVIERGAALTAKLVLGAMARPAADGGPPVLSLPVTVQERTLYTGPVALARLPAVRWTGRWPP